MEPASEYKTVPSCGAISLSWLVSHFRVAWHGMVGIGRRENKEDED
jgi:hypothetical protein